MSWPRAVTDISARSLISTLEPSRSRSTAREPRAVRTASPSPSSRPGASGSARPAVEALERPAHRLHRGAAARRHGEEHLPHAPAGEAGGQQQRRGDRRSRPNAARCRRRCAARRPPRQHRQRAGRGLAERGAAGRALAQVVLDEQRARRRQLAAAVRRRAARSRRRSRGSRRSRRAVRRCVRGEPLPHPRRGRVRDRVAAASSSRTAAIASSRVTSSRPRSCFMACPSSSHGTPAGGGGASGAA